MELEKGKITWDMALALEIKTDEVESESEGEGEDFVGRWVWSIEGGKSRIL